MFVYLVIKINIYFKYTYFFFIFVLDLNILKYFLKQNMCVANNYLNDFLQRLLFITN